MQLLLLVLALSVNKKRKMRSGNQLSVWITIESWSQHSISARYRKGVLLELLKQMEQRATKLCVKTQRFTPSITIYQPYTILKTHFCEATRWCTRACSLKTPIVSSTAAQILARTITAMKMERSRLLNSSPSPQPSSTAILKILKKPPRPNRRWIRSWRRGQVKLRAREKILW